MLAHIHCSIFVNLAGFDLLAAIYCPEDHSQLKGWLRSRIAGQLELELEDWVLKFCVNSSWLLANSSDTDTGKFGSRIGEWTWVSTGYARIYTKGVWAAL
jgi:hypothetical protein